MRMLGGTHLGSNADVATRAVGLAATAVLFSGIGLAAAGGSPATAGGHAGRTAHTASADSSAYLARLRRVTAQVDTVVSPVQKVLDATISSRFDWLLAAHDAVGHSDAAPLLRSEEHRLRALQPPPQASADHHRMVTALDELRTSVAGLHSKGPLPNDAGDLGSAAIVNEEDDWDTAVHATFRLLHAPAPRALDRTHYSHLKPSRTTWIYGADRSCLAAAHVVRNTKALVAGTPSVYDVERFNSLWEKALHQLGHDLAKLPRPTGSSAMPPALIRGLRTFDATSNIFSRFNTEIRDHDTSAIPGTQAALDAAIGEQRTLGGEMKKYGATVCGIIVHNWSRTHPTNGGGSTHLAA